VDFKHATTTTTTIIIIIIIIIIVIVISGSIVLSFNRRGWVDRRERDIDRLSDTLCACLAHYYISAETTVVCRVRTG
jgi:flagellar basal body-associated protein FliL